MIYNLSILSNNETSIKDVISAFKIINLEARYLELKRIFTGLLKNYNDKIQSSNNRLVEHNKDIVPGRLTYDALTTFVIVELLTNEFLQREFVTKHILRPQRDNRDIYVASTDIVTIEDDLKENLNMLFDYVYNPYLLFDFSRERRIDDNIEIRLEMTIEQLKKMDQLIRKEMN